jgi:hypothetical protein
VVSLPQLVANATHIVIGTCRDVQRPRGDDLITVTIDVEQQLRGTMPSTIRLHTNARNTEGPDFGVGSRKLLFLRSMARAVAQGGAAGSEVAFEPVERGAGVIDIAHQGAIEATVAIVAHALDPRSASRLVGVRDWLVRRTPPPPRPLVAALLDGSPTSEAVDRTLVVEMACDSAGTYLPAARLWAMSRAGTLRLRAARSCLEALVAPSLDSVTRLSAVDALGDLGDSRSSAVLLTLIEEFGSTARASHGHDLTLAAVLALGKIRATAAVPALGRLSQRSRDLALSSTLVHSLGLIGGPDAVRELTHIAASHPHALVREQARHTADQQPVRRIP